MSILVMIGAAALGLAVAGLIVAAHESYVNH